MEGEVLQAILQVSLLVFVVSSMLAMGLDLTIGQIIEPLKAGRLVAKLARRQGVMPWSVGRDRG
jgi:hypothetical protein